MDKLILVDACYDNYENQPDNTLLLPLFDPRRDEKDTDLLDIVPFLIGNTI